MPGDDRDLSERPSLPLAAYVAVIEGAGWFGLIYLLGLIQGLLMP